MEAIDARLDSEIHELDFMGTPGECHVDVPLGQAVAPP